MQMTKAISTNRYLRWLGRSLVGRFWPVLLKERREAGLLPLICDMKIVKRLLLLAAVFAFILYRAGFTAQENQGGAESQMPELFPSNS